MNNAGFWPDWIGWFCSNVVIGALAPIIVLTFIALFRRAVRQRAPVDFFAAFRDGQLGYVGLGWAAGGFAELVKTIALAKVTTISMLVAAVLLVVAAAFNGIIAGVNAIGPSPLTAATTPVSVWTLEWWTERYFAFTSSLFVSVVTLALAAWVHTFG